MACSDSAYKPSSGSASSTVLPEQQCGFIDLKTLDNIQQSLRESTQEDDRILASWIQERYLYEPITESNQPIRTPEEFSQLDRAYRRVRSLTNKAQDKWPFFDRNFNKMSSSTVRNNARGEAAPGVSFRSLSETDEARATADGNDNPPPVSAVQRFQLPFGEKQPSQVQAKQKGYSYSGQQTINPLATSKSTSPPSHSESGEHSNASLSAELPSIGAEPPQRTPNKTANQVASNMKGKALRRSTPLHEEMSARMRTGSETSRSKSVSDGTADEESEVDANSEMEPVGDASGSKIRGPNGRYLSKVVMLSSAAAKSVQKSGGGHIKCVKKSKSQHYNRTEKTNPAKPQRPARDTRSKAAAPIGQELALSASSTSSTAQVESDHAIDGVAGTEESDQTHDSSVSSHDFASSYTLAAEAEAVSSNLDRLPPGLIKRSNRKRKSDPAVQPEETAEKRTRGRFGGVIGRPRKADVESSASKQKAKNDTDTSPQKGGETSMSPIQTRRQTRQSAVAAANSMEGLGQGNESANEDEDREDNERRQDKPGGHEGRKSQRPHGPEPDLLSIGLNYTNPPSQGRERGQPLAASSPNLANTPARENRAGPVPGQIEYFARIHTSSGTRDIPIAEDKLEKDERETIQKYAEWVEDEDSPNDISYKQFRSIFGLAKKG